MRLADSERCGLLLDFDHTLFDTDRFFWVDLKSAFARFGVPNDAWEKSYEAIWPLGYSLAKHLDELERLGVIAGQDIGRTMLATLEADFSDLRPYLFPDVPAFLKAARQRGFDLMQDSPRCSRRSSTRRNRVERESCWMISVRPTPSFAPSTTIPPTWTR